MSNGCVQVVKGSHHHAGFPAPKDPDATIRQARQAQGLGDPAALSRTSGCLAAFPEWSELEVGMGVMKAGGAMLLSGLVAHGAGPNLGAQERRAMSFVFMPQGATQNANHGAIPEAIAERTRPGMLLQDDGHLPLLYSSRL